MDTASEPPPRRMPAVRHVPRRVTRLRVARLVGATVVAILGQFTVDMPGGWFGAADEVTAEGALYCAVLALATALEACLPWLRRGPARTTVLTPLILSISVGAFVPALATDPFQAAIVILWQVVVLARHYLDRPRPMARRALARHFDPDAPPQAWLARYGAAVRHLVLVALVAWLVVVGYELADHPLARATCVVANLLPLVPVSRLLRLLVRHGSRASALVWLPLVGAAAAALQGSVGGALTFAAVHQALALWVLLRHSPTFAELARHFHSRPALFVVNSFGAAIVLGAGLLTFPAAAAHGTTIAPIDALFTSTSAVCVTGLVVLDTPVHFSPFGHLVLLILIQVGGLGIMVLSAFATIALGGRIGLRAGRALGEQLDGSAAASAERLTRFVVVSTLAVEACGAMALYGPFRSAGLAPLEAAWNAVFHSVSAFCNAGFALRSDSLVAFRDQPLTLGVFAALVTLGGLGFAVVSSLWARLTGRATGRIPVGVRVVAWMSVLLTVGGAAAYAALEWEHSLAGLPWEQRLTNAAFLSVSARTAGFNTVDMAAMGTPALLLMSALMLVGASPGGTGGGIKTTTAAVLAMTIPAMARGETRVTLFGRTIPQVVVYRAAAIAGITGAVVLVAVAVLSGTQAASLGGVIFEVASAVGTVGLSTGVTGTLDAFGKYVVILLMFAGRTGPLTLALTVGRPAPRRTQLPEEQIAIG